MRVAEELRKHADLAIKEGGMYYSGEYLDAIARRAESEQAENTKLRELVRRYGEYISYDSCEGCVYKSRCDNDEIDECWQRTEIRELARELGVWNGD